MSMLTKSDGISKFKSAQIVTFARYTLENMRFRRQRAGYCISSNRVDCIHCFFLSIEAIKTKRERRRLEYRTTGGKVQISFLSDQGNWLRHMRSALTRDKSQITTCSLV